MIIVPFAVYDQTGFIRYSGKTPPNNVALQADPDNGLSVLVGEYKQGTHYVVDGEAVERPAMDCQISATTISNLPVPCKVLVNGEVIDVSDGVLELSFEVPGTYPLVVQAFPFLDWKGVIDAV